MKLTIIFIIIWLITVVCIVSYYETKIDNIVKITFNLIDSNNKINNAIINEYIESN